MSFYLYNLIELASESYPFSNGLGSMHMLDPSGNKEVKMILDEIKDKITAHLQREIDVNAANEEDLEQLVGPKDLVSLRDALQKIGNPRVALDKIYETMRELISQLSDMLGELASGDERRGDGGEGLKGESEVDLALSGVKLYKGETLLELTERWRFIFDRLYDEVEDRYDLSRIPDVHDNVRFEYVSYFPHVGVYSRHDLTLDFSVTYLFFQCIA